MDEFESLTVPQTEAPSSVEAPAFLCTIGTLQHCSFVLSHNRLQETLALGGYMRVGDEMGE